MQEHRQLWGDDERYVGISFISQHLFVGYISQRQFDKVIDLFGEIDKPNEMIVVLLFNACTQLRTKEALNLAKRVAGEMPSSFHANAYIITSLIDALMKCGDVEGAEKIFSPLTMKNQAIYGAMMKGKLRG